MINPGGIPRIPGDMEVLARHAQELTRVGPAFSATGEQVNSTWQQLAPVYDAPEVGQLLAATGPVQTTAASVGADIATVGGALSTYATTVKQIQNQLDALRTQAQDLVAEAAADKANEGTLEQVGEFVGIGGDDDEYAERSNELASQVNAQVAAFNEAQRVCANTINALYGGTQYRADDGDGQQEPGEYGYTAEQLDTAFEQGQELPWGSYAETDTGIVGGVWDGAKMFVGDLGALIGRDPTTGEWSWGTAGTAWKGLGTFALAVGTYAIPGGAALDQALNDGKLGDTLVAAGKGIIAYDEWGQGDNARAGGMAGFNILSAIVGTKGAGSALRGVGAGAQTSRIGAVSRVGGAMVRSGEFIARLPTTESLIGRVSQHLPGMRLPGGIPDVNVPHHADTPHADIPRVDTPRVDTPNPGSVGDNLTTTDRAPDSRGAPIPDTPSTPDVDLPGPRAHDGPTPGAAVPDAPSTPDAPTTPEAPRTPDTPSGPDGSAPDAPSTPADRVPGTATPGDTTPGDTMSGDGTPGDTTPGDSTPGDGTPGDSKPGDATPGDGASSDGPAPTGTQPDGSWIGREHGSEFTLTPEQNAAADRFLAGARADEGQISPQVTSVADNIDGARMQGYPDFVLKGEDSLKRKLVTDLAENPDLSLNEAITGLRDSVRYTIEVPPTNYADGVVRAVDDLRARGFENVTWKPTWDTPDSYKGVNSTWRDPATGRVFEVQFHTPDSFAAKMATHELYEAQRVPGVSAEEVARLRAEQGEIFRRVDVPPGTERLTALGDDLARDRQPVAVGAHSAEGAAAHLSSHQADLRPAGTAGPDPTPQDNVPGTGPDGGGLHGDGGRGTDGSDRPVTGGDGDLPRRPENLAEPHPALDLDGRVALDQRQARLADQHPTDYDDWRLNDPAHPGKEGHNQDIESRIALDLREQDRLPEDVTRPTNVEDGDFIDPSTGEKWDVKGFYSDWPDHIPPDRRHGAFPQALTPEKFRDSVARALELRPGERYGDRNVILNTRNLDQDTIDFMQRIIDEEGWGDRVVWYP
ncbi:MAG TPA: hypothetical protein VE709_03500 [Pseudonocardiaceae bacterium]|nr:hypothetical protein [Pseudonocardiaceae bacterium]